MGKFRLSATRLKWLGCLFMLVDHIGLLLLPQYRFLRVVGRLAFPIFAYMLANGYRHTRSRGKYLLRLAAFALAIQPLYSRFIGGWNIFFTLFFGLAAIAACQWLREDPVRQRLAFLPPLALALLAQGMGADYGAYGVLLILCAHLFYGRFDRLTLAWAFTTMAHVLLYWPNIDQLWALLSIPLLMCYDGERGRGWKWSFYLFYVLHLAVLCLLREYLL